MLEFGLIYYDLFKHKREPHGPEFAFELSNTRNYTKHLLLKQMRVNESWEDPML